MFRVGIGFDAHRFTSKKKLILGGVEIEGSRGLEGHSDADVLSHSICDAILGAISEGDIGMHFPDTDPGYKDISSIKLLTQVNEILKNKGFKIVNIDTVVVCEKPKISPYFSEIREILSKTLKTNPEVINIKATTTEKMGFTGREEGISAKAVVLVKII